VRIQDIPVKSVSTVLEPENTMITRMLGELEGFEAPDTRNSSASYLSTDNYAQLEKMVKDDRVHPEALGLSRYSFELAGAINFGPLRFRSDSSNGEKLREELLRKFMGRIRIALGISGKQFRWVATTEYGYENRPHCHFLVGLPQSLAQTPYTVLELQSEIKFTDLAGDYGEATLGDLKLTPISSHFGAVAYLCKEEYHRPNKDFYYSRSLISDR
jgi:hypothetical protein